MNEKIQIKRVIILRQNVAFLLTSAFLCVIILTTRKPFVMKDGLYPRNRREIMNINDIEKDKAIEKMTESLPVLRTMLHISQAELAELIGVGRQTLVAFETKKRTMTWNTFLSLLFVFSQRQETKDLLTVLGVYSEELKKLYKNQ